MSVTTFYLSFIEAIFSVKYYPKFCSKSLIAFQNGIIFSPASTTLLRSIFVPLLKLIIRKKKLSREEKSGACVCYMRSSFFILSPNRILSFDIQFCSSRRIINGNAYTHICNGNFTPTSCNTMACHNTSCVTAAHVPIFHLTHRHREGVFVKVHVEIQARCRIIFSLSYISCYLFSTLNDWVICCDYNSIRYVSLCLYIHHVG